MRETVEPTQGERGEEQHPAWGMISAHRYQNSPPGAVLFDSDIRHQHTIGVSISTASRRRDLNRDWLHAERDFIEIEMSEAQWASFVSGVGGGSGVPCTIRRREDGNVPGTPFQPRLQESMDEVADAASKAQEQVVAAFEAYNEHRTAANRRALEFAIRNMPANITFAAQSLTEHAENVVQRARADIEAMVVTKAAQLGIEPSALGFDTPQLTEGEKQ